MAADICPEMQVECGGREQVIWKMRHTHTETGTRVKGKGKHGEGETNQTG